MSLPRLTADLLASDQRFPADLKHAPAGNGPERILQFGEGNFLRGFVDWMVHKLNRDGHFDGRVVAVQPIAQGLVDKLNEQQGAYTLMLRGVQNGAVVEQKEVITSISRGINPYADFAGFMKTADNPDMRFIVSNTTESGIVFSAADKAADAPPASFPGKLTAWLYRRFLTFKGDAAKGCILLPCELIESNGGQLKKTVLQVAAHWQLPAAFAAWVESANHFTNTLVDRIVTGYPREEAAGINAALGYEDALLNTAEPFCFWAIEGEPALAEELPLHQAGLKVVWARSIKPYRDRKVRILNGAHTMTVLAAYLAGKDTVKECMDDDLIRGFMIAGINEEILPTLDLPAEELKAFAAAVAERFANPFIKHALLSISLNSTSKFKSRILPSIKEYVRRKGKLPQRLTFSLAALIAFYRGTEMSDGALVGTRDGAHYRIQDDLAVLEVMKALWRGHDGSAVSTGALVMALLGQAEIWGEDLTQLAGFADRVTQYLQAILTIGSGNAMKALDKHG